MIITFINTFDYKTILCNFIGEIIANQKQISYVINMEFHQIKIKIMMLIIHALNADLM